MADGSVGAIWVPSGSAEIRDTILRDIRLEALKTIDEPPVQPGTDWYILATALGEMGIQGFANVAISDEDRSVLTATGDALDDLLEANGLPQIPASGSAGKVKIAVSGSTSIVAGTALLLPNGLRIQTVGNYINPSDGAEVDVAAIDTGEDTNLAGGETVRFVSAPTNVSEEATVSYGEPLTGGTDGENDARKRARLLNTLRNKPAGGNWADIRRVALEALGSVQDCYVFPGLGGPGSALVVPVKDFDEDVNDYSRALSDAAIQTVRSAIHAKLPGFSEIVVRASGDESVDFTILVSIPASSLSGGNGRGWTDSMPWPRLENSDGGHVAISSVSAGNNQITVNADTTTSPATGHTHICWWSSVDMEFYTALVTGVSGGTGAWVLSLDRPLVSSDGTGPAIGDFVCPSAQNLAKYGKAWLEMFRALGPGECTADVNRLPRAKRHPFAADEDPSGITNSALLALVKRFPEITDIDFGHAPQRQPTIGPTVAYAPNILIPRRFAVYELT
jgi:hypothetical protein